VPRRQTLYTTRANIYQFVDYRKITAKELNFFDRPNQIYLKVPHNVSIHLTISIFRLILLFIILVKITLTL